jgi:hypothetical protein
MNAPRRVTLLARRATVLFEQLVNKIPMAPSFGLARSG